MPCPTCGHELAMLCNMDGGDKVVFRHCERCGTVVRDLDHEWRDVWVPKLVERCRQFAADLTPAANRRWIRLGIHESINTPENSRPKEECS